MSKKTSSRRLNFCTFKLDTLLDITLSINNNTSIKELLNKFENIVTQQLNIGKLIIYEFNKTWVRILISGFDDSYPEIDVEKDLLLQSDITTTTAANLTHLEGIDTIIPVYHNNKAVAFVLIGDIDEEREGVSPTIRHLLFIQTLTNIIIVANENQRLQEESLRQEAIRKEMELASRMQSMLIPDSLSFPRNEKIYVDAFYLPHFDVGGDYYDFFPLNEEEFAFCISDVSGKGISAAILMSNFQANLKAIWTSEIPLETLVEKLNTRVLDSANGEKFITMFVGKFNTRTKELRYINAGHNPPFLYNKATKELSFLQFGCPGMGMVDDIPRIKKGIVKIKSESKLLCYTDGLVEIQGENTTDAGMKDVGDCFSDGERIDASIQKIITELAIDRSNKRYFDDISLLGIEFF